MSLCQDNIIIEGTQEIGRSVNITTSVEMSSGIYQLTNTSNSQVIFTGSTSGQIVKLPDATTLRIGWNFLLWNTGSVSFVLQDNGGNAVATANINELINVTVTNISTANGIWSFRKGSIKSATELTKTDIGLGNVTNDAQIPKSIGTTTGDLIGFSAANTSVRIPVGLDGQILVADSSQAVGVKWSSNVAVGVAYGEIYENSSSGTSITLTDIGTYYKWTTGTIGLTSGTGYVVGSAINKNLTIGVNGVGIYAVNFSISMMGPNNVFYYAAVFKNNNKLSNIESSMKQNAGVVAGMSSCGLVSLSNNDVVDLRISSSNANPTTTIYFVQFTIHRVG